MADEDNEMAHMMGHDDSAERMMDDMGREIEALRRERDEAQKLLLLATGHDSKGRVSCGQCGADLGSDGLVEALVEMEKERDELRRQVEEAEQRMALAQLKCPTEPCCVCSEPVCTREGCPQHPGSAELEDGRWVCGVVHWGKAVGPDDLRY